MFINTLSQLVREHVADAVGAVYPQSAGVSFVVSEPPHTVRAHAACNVAMILAAQLKQSPLAIAEALRAHLLADTTTPFADVAVVAPGYLNVCLRAEVLATRVSTLRLHPPGSGQMRDLLSTRFTYGRVLIEHTSPTFPKALHIGHLMNNAIGEFIVRAVRLSKPDADQGDVAVMSFPSDISPSFAKALLCFAEQGGLATIAGLSPAAVVTVLGECYAAGVAREKAGDAAFVADVTRVCNDLYRGADTPEARLYAELLAICKAYLQDIGREFGSTFDTFLYESAAGAVGTALVLDNIAPGRFERSEGAIIHAPSEPNVHTAVFINSQGNPTYAAKDLGLIGLKFDTTHPDRSIAVLDREQQGHFQTVFSAARALGGEWVSRVDNSEIVFHGRMTFKGQRMSSRLGGIPLAHDILAQLTELAAEASRARATAKADSTDVTTHRRLALSAIKVAILRSKPGIAVSFDPDTSLSFDGDSGPYLLYSFARCSSLLRKGEAMGLTPHAVPPEVFDTDVVIKLLWLPDVLAAAINDLAPQKVVTYLFELANAFNHWYTATRILDDTDPVGSRGRLALVARVKDALDTGLYLLGLSGVESL